MESREYARLRAVLLLETMLAVERASTLLTPTRFSATAKFLGLAQATRILAFCSKSVDEFRLLMRQSVVYSLSEPRVLGCCMAGLGLGLLGLRSSGPIS